MCVCVCLCFFCCNTLQSSFCHPHSLSCALQLPGLGQVRRRRQRSDGVRRPSDHAQAGSCQLCTAAHAGRHRPRRRGAKSKDCSDRRRVELLLRRLKVVAAAALVLRCFDCRSTWLLPAARPLLSLSLSAPCLVHRALCSLLLDAIRSRAGVTSLSCFVIFVFCVCTYLCSVNVL